MTRREPAPTPEENSLRTRARNAAAQKSWDEAFLLYQKLLFSTRGRFDRRLENEVLREFSTLLKESGDKARAARIPHYLKSQFD